MKVRSFVKTRLNNLTVHCKPDGCLTVYPTLARKLACSLSFPVERTSVSSVCTTLRYCAVSVASWETSIGCSESHIGRSNVKIMSVECPIRERSNEYLPTGNYNLE